MKRLEDYINKGQTINEEVKSTSDKNNLIEAIKKIRVNIEPDDEGWGGLEITKKLDGEYLEYDDVIKLINQHIK